MADKDTNPPDEGKARDALKSVLNEVLDEREAKAEEQRKAAAEEEAKRTKEAQDNSPLAYLKALVGF